MTAANDAGIDATAATSEVLTAARMFLGCLTHRSVALGCSSIVICCAAYQSPQALRPSQHINRSPWGHGGFLSITSSVKHQCTLRLRRRADVPFDSQMREKRIDLVSSHGGRVTLSMKENETLRPAQIRLLGAAAVVARPHGGANPIEKAWWLGHRPRLPRVGASVKLHYDG